MNSLRRRCGLLLRPVAARINVIPKATVSSKIHWRAYFSFRSSPMGFRIRESKISCQSFLPSSRHRFSSFSSPLKSGTGVIRWYLRKLDTYPFITKSISSSLIYVAADLTSQMITLPSPGSFDLIRTTRMAAYGLLILGPSQHLWFNFMSTVSPRRDYLSTFKKIVLGQAVYGPTLTSIFFSYNASLQGESGSEIAARLQRDLLPTLLNGLLFWPVCDFLTYKFVPVHLQPLTNSSFAYIWTIYLTYMASLKGVDMN
ncbi:PXMP2/4 family protein 4-like [Cucurbita moschata]|uniref:PXMP2/4 family protein 4-like n=1 Tax=Cucurbita moschata TaxID=3662 RepID=A0A6J1GGF6_CUCMO|nr:PXMP2/4 family protein 4-like [Cucurbita moschata]XP_022951026.1 PXMP2/4 family protein 4-like [Cucurbita moschata]